MLSPGVITILCHAGGLLPVIDSAPATGELLEHILNWPAHAHNAGVSHVSPFGPAPRAENDQASTPEEKPVTINVLANDRSGQSDNDDDDDDDDGGPFGIDRSTVDLDPDQSGRQSLRIIPQGNFTVNDDGIVTFVPAVDFFGAASIQYTVSSRAWEASNRATITVNVSNVNDAPAITGIRHETLPAVAGKPTSIEVHDLIIADPDGHALSDFTLIILPGERYTSSGNTVTPDQGVSGELPVQVQVSDGQALSQAFTIRLTVTDENDPPEITGQNPAVTDEDQPFIVTPGHLLVEDDDDTYPTGFTIHLAPGEHYTVAGQTVTPAPDFFGPLSVPATVNDGESNSNVFILTITVNPINDRPVITGQQPVATGQNMPIAITLGHLTVTDPDHTYPDEFGLTVLPGDHYSVSGNTVTPAPGFFGTLSVNVTVSDPVTTSATFPLKVNVAANTAPQITGQTPLSTEEEVAVAISLSHLQVSDPDNTYPVGFTLRVEPGQNYSVSGHTVTPAPNFFGTLTVPVVVNDGSSDSDPFQLAITVSNINDAPLITGQVPLTTEEGQPITLTLPHLIVSDSDNDYPNGFSLVVLSGENYSVSGSVVTPAPGMNGPMQVGVMVNDGAVNSNVFLLVVNVAPVNDPPEITGQRSLEIQEGGAITLSLQDLTVTDPDNTYPQGFSLVVQPGANYSVSGTTVTPSENFTGVLAVNVLVNDGQTNSALFALQITVTPQNDAPTITGPATLTTSEDTPITLALADLQVTDPDNAYPTGFSLVVLPGERYTRSGNTVIPEANFSGTLQVEVQVSDGVLTSNIFPIALHVLPVNDPPVIAGQVPVETPEDTPVTIQLSHLTVLDVDNQYPAGFSIVISPGNYYSVSGTMITPVTDFNGTLNVNLAVSDGQSNSAPFTFQIQVGNANDAPVITGQVSLATQEEQAVTLQLSHLSVTDPDNTYPNGFSLLVSPGANYTVSGTTITPALNFAGELKVQVRVNDGINNSATFDFKLQVNQVNDAPQFAAIANQEIAENTAAGSVTIREVSKGPQEDHQQLTFVATSGNTAIIPDPVVQYDGGPTAVLSYSVTPNTSGVVTITVVAIDNGANTAPHQNSYSSSFQVQVMEINAAPTLDVINNITILEDAEQQNVNLTGITAGPGETQPLTVSVTTAKPEFFDMLEVAYNSPEPAGQLRFKTKANVHGPVSLSVTVSDNGSGISPHVNRVTRTFVLEIRPVNDPPVFTTIAPTLAVRGEPYEYPISATDPDGENITISALRKPGWATLTNGKPGEAVLKGTPPQDASGNAEVTLQVKDAAAVVEQSFVVYVNVRPALTHLTLVTDEDTPRQLPASYFEGGYTDENGNALEALLITMLPSLGQLSSDGLPVKVGDTIAAASLSGLVYAPYENGFGTDGFEWKAYDGFHFSSAAGKVEVSVLPVNDPPVVVFQNDTLQYEVNGEPVLLAPLVEIVDPDDDSLSHAVIAFRSDHFQFEMDMLQFDNVGGIRGNYDFQSGVLTFTGHAPLAEYRTALQSVRYLYQNTIDPLLEPRTVSFSLHDGEGEGTPEDKVIMLQYTFVEFEIPSGFTPNGDRANDTWIIDRPGGGLEEIDNAIISVYNRQGVLVFRARGFDTAWDGTFNGELLPADAYFYTIDLQLRNRKTYKGIVTILR